MTAGVLLLWAACYVLGSIPFGFLAGRVLANVDIRAHGSGNIGATNVLRTLGKGPAAFVLVLDAAKGWVGVWAASSLGMGEGPVAGAAVAAVAGHNWPVFLGFRGGRGMATGLGAVIGLSPSAAVLLVLVWLVLVVLTRYVSVGSIAASALLPASLAVLGEPAAYIVAGAIIGLWGVWRHRPNIRRLLSGVEHRLGERTGLGPPSSRAG
ncbi:MAG: glycerol-3-phosphate 1-O-acyltransferase PlsY [Firmicutes bacterium]|nr:glycerol-3-phosphate 1-O-acyltransferase PlsY [Bacillota bacterium]